ncbi:MAG: hypothetical protein HUK15_08725 [Bacteroidales bacterium]|nr:hypothetical protein [Bacteroidales bacterium]
MIIANKVKKTIATAKEGEILRIADFRVEPQYQQALVMSLSRKVKSGELKKISKGRYYKPKKSVFGMLPPASSEIYKEFLQNGDKTIGYITGFQAFAQMGITTQISSVTVIGTNKSRRTITRGENQIAFLLQPNPINAEDIPLLRILDALRMFKEIPATSPDNCIRKITLLIDDLPMNQKEKLQKLAIAYTPFVRALVGAIFEYINQPELANYMRMSINGLTNFRLPISQSVLPNKKNWNII